MKQSMILLHGLFGGLSNWNGMTAHFAGRYDIHIPSLPVYEAHEGDSLEYLLQFLEKYVETYSLKDIIFVGNSLGGHVAILYAHRHPEKTGRLILTGSSGLYENTSLGRYPKRGNYDYIRGRVEYTFYDPAVATDELVNEVFLTTTDIRKCYYVVKMAKCTQRNYVDNILSEIAVKTLLIWGAEDRITPPDVAKEFERLLPDTKLVLLRECGHAPMMEKPEEFCETVDEWLREK